MDKQAAQVLVTELHDEIKRANGKEMHATPTLLLLAAKMTIEELLREVTVLDTTLALREGTTPQRLETPTRRAARNLAEGLGVSHD